MRDLRGVRGIDRLALVTLVASNLLLVIFAVGYRWSYYVPLVVFWLEIVVVGLYNVVKMSIVAIAGEEPLGRWIGFDNVFSAVVSTFMMISFFAVKFGGFVLGLGFLTILLPAFFDAEAGGFAVLEALRETGLSIAIGIIILTVSHGVSFVGNFIRKREYERTNLLVLLFWPYVRALWLAITILAGMSVGALLPFKDPGVGFAVALVIVKLAGDLGSHVFEHVRFSEEENA